MNKLKQTSMLSRDSKTAIETIKDTIFREPNLIGISGKSGAGKDLIGRIIQYLTNPSTKDSEREFEIGNDYSPGCPFEVRRFADKLKDMVCILINCSREDLENREFKEKELGKEWWYYKLLTTINDRTNWYQLQSYREELKGKLEGKYLIKTTPRLLLQLLGTECGKEIIHPNIWVNSLFSKYKPVGVLDNRGYKQDVTIYPSWVITDVRFENEVEAIKKRGGITIRVNRKISKEEDVNQSLLGAMSNYKEHPSETALDDYQDWDYVIQNDGTIPDLVLKVEEILLKERVIYK